MIEFYSRNINPVFYSIFILTDAKPFAIRHVLLRRGLRLDFDRLVIAHAVLYCSIWKNRLHVFCLAKANWGLYMRNTTNNFEDRCVATFVFCPNLFWCLLKQGLKNCNRRLALFVLHGTLINYYSNNLRWVIIFLQCVVFALVTFVTFYNYSNANSLSKILNQKVTSV